MSSRLRKERAAPLASTTSDGEFILEFVHVADLMEMRGFFADTEDDNVILQRCISGTMPRPTSRPFRS